MLNVKCFVAIVLSSFCFIVVADYCGENRVAYGLEVHRNGQPSLLCARPNCAERKFTDCEDRAVRKSCPENNTLVGGFDKGYGSHQPLYLLCCVFDDLVSHSTPLYNSVAVHPGEYFEGEEQVDEIADVVLSFDVITDIRMIRDPNSTVAYEIDVRRVSCKRSSRRKKRKRPIKWP